MNKVRYKIIIACLITIVFVFILINAFQVQNRSAVTFNKTSIEAEINKTPLKAPTSFNSTNTSKIEESKIELTVPGITFETKSDTNNTIIFGGSIIENGTMRSFMAACGGKEITKEGCKNLTEALQKN